ncbi:hypothetical protein [Streptomyces sp. P17]|uniref:hypothetical protein n=1 Tax=Streptomyces sp. P17 TaxID=3074716 RepID=UPI0028F41607|nr:hypothetical protein [Streptomyces sp. P17]MDT9700004.1 hypothetical protein [Streptomyces sp. P17]
MADEQYRWLDPETAERLLRGEPLEAVDAADRDQAERLAKTLESLTVEPPPLSAELPGEAAALAAFRAARTERADAPAPLGHPSGPHSSDAGLVRLGSPARGARRPRWARPVRLGLAAALAVGMVGGVAVAAGTGVLPTPFDGSEPEPAASVSAAVPPERPLVSPSPDDAVEGESVPDAEPTAPAPDASRQTPGGGTDPGATTGRQEDRAGGSWNGAVTSACRDLYAGKRLGDDSRRALEAAAGGSARVSKYCKALAGDSADGEGRGKGESDGRGTGQDDEDDKDGDGKGRDHRRPGNDHRTDGATSDTPSSSTTPLLPERTPSPAATDAASASPNPVDSTL